MRRNPILALLAVATGTALIASEPAAQAAISAGLWEISGAPGGTKRICVSDVLKLAQFEHRDRNCRRTGMTDKPGSIVMSYNCGSGDFGRSQVDVLTPRSLRISTQGISDQLPFNYTLQARRIGDCPKGPERGH